MAIAIARACIRGGARGRFYTAVDLVNRLESEARAGQQGRLADYLTRIDFVVLDELGYLPFAQAGGQLLFHLTRSGFLSIAPNSDPGSACNSDPGVGGVWACPGSEQEGPARAEPCPS